MEDDYQAKRFAFDYDMEVDPLYATKIGEKNPTFAPLTPIQHPQTQIPDQMYPSPAALTGKFSKTGRKIPENCSQTKTQLSQESWFLHKFLVSIVLGSRCGKNTNSNN